MAAILIRDCSGRNQTLGSCANSPVTGAGVFNGSDAQASNLFQIGQRKLPILLVFWILLLFSSAKGGVLDQWNELIGKLEASNPASKSKTAFSENLGIGRKLVSSFSRREKLQIIESFKAGEDKGENYLSDILLEDGVENDDVLLIQKTLEKFPIHSVRGVTVFEFLAVKKKGIYVSCIPSAYKFSKDPQTKMFLMQGFTRYFEVRYDKNQKYEYLQKCVFNFFSSGMVKSDKIRNIELYHNGRWEKVK